MTLATMLADLYRRLGYASSPDSGVTTRLTSFLNTAHRKILATPGLEGLRDDTITFASVASQATYGLPPAVSLIHDHGISERTNNITLDPRSLAWVRRVDPGLTASGVSTAYIPRGLQQVAIQPSDASSIFVDSTSASDTNTCYIEGFRTGGYPKSVSVSMTGTTAVDVSTATTDWIEITKFYLSSAAVGTVTLHEDASGGTELARIPIGQLYARYQGVQLWPTPAAALTYYVDYTRTIADMSNTTDEPLLPEEFHWVLVEGALLLEFDKKDDTERRIQTQLAYDIGMGGLRFRFANLGGTPNLRGLRGAAPSRLGGQYPGGS